VPPKLSFCPNSREEEKKLEGLNGKRVPGRLSQKKKGSKENWGFFGVKNLPEKGIEGGFLRSRKAQVGRLNG